MKLSRWGITKYDKYSLIAESLTAATAIFQNSSRKIQVPVRHLCAVRKVVWSSFDYMTGPELGFTWEAVTAASEATSSGKSSLSDSSRDDSSLTSSVTKGGGSAADYEEIDDVYRVSYLVTRHFQC